MTTSNSSASGSTATDAAEVWTRPCVSVAGTLCTRCTPDSYFKIPYTLSPVTLQTTSLNPPAVPSFALETSIFQPLVSQNLAYIRKRSPAKIAASSPPAPPRISRIAFLLSCGSAGTSISLISSSNTGRRSWLLSISSFAISRISASDSLARIFLASSILPSNWIYSFLAFIKSSNSLYSLVNLT